LTKSTSSATRHLLEPSLKPSPNRRGAVLCVPAGDKTFVGGNDYEIFTSPRTVGHSIDDADPMTTLKKLSTLFDLPCPPSLTPPAAH